MAHRPTLYIGIGGTGCKTLALIRKNFREKYGAGKIPEYIRFFCIDTDIVIEEGMASNTYVIENVPCGPDADRTEGRRSLEQNMQDILIRIRGVLSELMDAAHSELDSMDIDVRLVMSLAGGTGSGIFIPLAMVLSQYKAVNLYGYAVLHGIFRKSDPGGPVYQKAFINTYASVLELDYLQHASADNHIKMTVAGIDCVLQAPLFKGFYMVEHLNNAGKIIQNQQDMHYVLALSMFSSSFEIAKDTRPDNDEGIYDIKDKKGWLGTFGACEIIFNGNKFAELYSHKTAQKIISDLLQKDYLYRDDVENFFEAHCDITSRFTLTEAIAQLIGSKSPAPLEFTDPNTHSIEDEVAAYIKTPSKNPNIFDALEQKASELKSYLIRIGNKPTRALHFIDDLCRQCSYIRTALSEDIDRLSQDARVEETNLSRFLSAPSSLLRMINGSDRNLSRIKETARKVAIHKHSMLVKEYGIFMLDRLTDLAKTYKEKVKAYQEELQIAHSHLSSSIKKLEGNLNSAASPFVYDATVQFWADLTDIRNPCVSNLELFGRFIDTGAGSLDICEQTLQTTDSLQKTCNYKLISLAEVIDNMTGSQYKAMMRFIRTSAIRMLMLDGRGYMINDKLNVECMTRDIVVSMYGNHKIDAMEASLEETWNQWDTCQTRISWNNITEESFRQKAIISVHEGNIIPYCVDAFYPEIVQKEYTEAVAEGPYNPHIDPILYERMKLSVHSLKPMQATINPEAQQTLSNPAKNTKETAFEDSATTTKVFIAGSKELKVERALLREELSKVENLFNLNIRTVTFEDFNTSLKGQQGGRQVDYNMFIRDVADIVIFIFDSKAGSITEEEFDTAYDSLAESGRPDIFVYGRNMSSDDRTLKKIKEKIFCYGQEYYVEYSSLDDLRYLILKDMVAYFK